MNRVLQRLAAVLALLLLIFLLAKGLLRVLPGDPVDAILAETGSNLDPEILRRDLGLDRPYLSAVFAQLKDLLFAGEWGNSIVMKRPIGPLIQERATSSAVLAGSALLTAVFFSFCFALLANLPHRGARFWSEGVRGYSALAVALPTTWIGPILGFLFAVHFRWFDLTGGIALPTLTLALALSGFWVRAFDVTLRREYRGDAVRYARAKGLGETRVLVKHAFFPAAGPLAAFFGSQTGALFAGAVITETLFDRPGLGALLVESIFKRDYPVIESVLIVSSAWILLGNFLGDLLQYGIQPKLRHADHGGAGA